MAEEAERRGNGHEEERVVFEYIKSAHFRVIHADGAIGAVTPNGFIHFALYSERAAIPRKIVHKIEEGGRLGEPIPEETVAREGIVREMDVDVFVTVEVAESLRNWLEEKIKTVKERQAGPTAEGRR